MCVQSHTCVISCGGIWEQAFGNHRMWVLVNSEAENVLFRAEPSLQPHCVTFHDKETGESGADSSQCFVCWPLPDYFYIWLCQHFILWAQAGSQLRSRLITKQIMYIIHFPELLRTLAVGLQTPYGSAELSQVGWGGNGRILLVLGFCCCLWWWL